MVTRYKEFYSTVLPNAEGEFVKYEDYERLETRYENLCQTVQKLVRQLELEREENE